MNSSKQINRREFNRHLLSGLSGALLAPAFGASPSSPAPSTPRQPNFVFILSDQHAFAYCGFMGHPIVRTPNLDRIARQGVVFRNAYCGSPVCAPSRAGMMSGCYPSDVNSFCNATTWDGNLPSWPALLRDAGYRTFGCGKLDTDDRFDLGFAETTVLTNEHSGRPDITAFFRRPLCARFEERAQIDGGRRSTRYKGDEHHTEATIAFIKNETHNTRPWAAYAGLHMPHPAFVGLQEHYDYYLNRVDLPNIPSGHLEGLPFAYQQLRNYKNIATPIHEDRIRRARAAYFAMITELDEYVGRIWAALEATDQLRNTIFVYSSDHGESLGEHGLWLKNNLYDGAARVPLVIAGAGIPQGKVVNTPVAHVDLIRTFLESAGAKTHPKLRGHSLIPLMRGDTGDHPGWAYTESHSEGNCTGSFMIRKGDWKYVHFTWYDSVLFNLADDPGEFVNRVDDPTATGVLAELRGILTSQVDPVEVTLRAFAVQRARLDRMASSLNENQILDEFRNRLGEGQAVALLSAYYGRTFAYEHKKPGGPAGY